MMYYDRVYIWPSYETGESNTKRSRKKFRTHPLGAVRIFKKPIQAETPEQWLR